MYYTIVPHEILFDEDHDVPTAQRRTIQVDGVPLIIEQSSTSEYEIVQILSSNPQDFLSEKIQPGKKMTLQPLLK
ncbi:hypothetical protein JOD43_002712 [Pullulanibacillus pueri]|uniref:YlzJ-like protein n=1 Tax=Pullulanibacillus pueri TaxID=1437324 RepID=A0A8J2ZW76_9BACL|nr:YlzJ-like family protein [Pullulanibacillus pueri]MBM7682534.1 hypothetical protein [Pullulanibacillus pueri]GGH82017.1 hypothetical protein GCM10007096_20770 [Pullulanibacillus pueri]